MGLEGSGGVGGGLYVGQPGRSSLSDAFYQTFYQNDLTAFYE